MKAVLDTSTFLWWITGQTNRLSDRVQEIIRDGRNILLFSVASAWEIAIKWELRKLKLTNGSLTEFLHEQIKLNGFQVLLIQLHHALHVSDLPRFHRDPFDRMLIAQCDIEGLPILTDDSDIRSYDIEVIW